VSSTIKNIFSELEELISEASRYNTEVISETTKFLTKMDSSKLNMKYFNNLQENILSDAIQKIVTLNVNYAKELMQMGIDLTKKLNETSEGMEANSNVSKPPMKSSVSAFKLETSATQGEEATTAFLLNSDKETPILCKVQNVNFQLDSDQSVSLDFKTEYSPQLFELIKGVAQRVDVKINIPATTPEGVYTSKINVAGFEHTHFDLIINVLKKTRAAVRKPKATSIATTKTTTKAKPKPNTTMNKKSKTADTSIKS
jgi:hypothetical protein